MSSSAALVAAVDDVVATVVGGLCAAELQERIAAVARERDRLDGWLSAAAGQLAAATGGRVATEDGGSRSVPGWLAEATRTSASTAGSQLASAARLRALPQVVAAVLQGRLSQEQAAVLSRLVGRVPDAALEEVQTQLVEVAVGRDPSALAHWVRHVVATHCEPALEADEAAAHDARFLRTRRDPDGSVRGRFRLAAREAEPVLTAIEALARRAGDADTRSAGQRRADALSELAEQVLRHGDLPDHGGHRPQICYVLPADWAARQHGRASCPTCARCPEHAPASVADTIRAALPVPRPPTAMPRPAVPAELACATAAWTGPATRSHLEALLCDARISRVLLDPTGQVRSLHTLSDTVTASQRRALAARDGGCTARGCTRPPAACDAHHLVHLEHGGSTALHNLVLLCRRHHVRWHLGRTTLADLHVPWRPSAKTGAGPPQE